MTEGSFMCLYLADSGWVGVPADFLCLLHLIQCPNASPGGVWLGEMNTRQDNPSMGSGVSAWMQGWKQDLRWDWTAWFSNGDAYTLLLRQERLKKSRTGQPEFGCCGENLEGRYLMPHRSFFLTMKTALLLFACINGTCI